MAHQNNPQPLANRQSGGIQLNQDTFDRLLNVQEKQLEIKARELVLEEHNQDNSLDYAKTLLATQATDQKERRSHAQTMAIIRNASIGVIAVLILAFAGWAIYMGKEQIAMEVLKIAGSALLGGIAGYGIRGFQQSGSSNQPPDSPTNG